MKLTTKLLSVLTLSAFLFTGCGKLSESIITINDDSITKSEYETAYNEALDNPMFAAIKESMKQDKDNVFSLMLKDKVTNELIVRHLLAQEVKSKNIKISDEDFNKEMENVVTNLGGKEKFTEALKQYKVSESQFKKDLKSQLEIRKLVDTIKPVKITEKQLKDYYNKNIDKFKNPERVRASHILISANKDEVKDIVLSENAGISKEELNKKITEELAKKKEKAQKVLKEVKANQKDFSKLAKENSDDVASAERGGDLGYFAKGDMVAEFSKVAFSQKPNTISEIVTTPYGYHIIMVTDRQTAGVEPFDKIAPSLKEYLANQEKVMILEKHIEQLKTASKINYIDESFNPTNIQKQVKDLAAKNAEAKKAEAATEKANVKGK